MGLCKEVPETSMDTSNTSTNVTNRSIHDFNSSIKILTTQDQIYISNDVFLIIYLVFSTGVGFILSILGIVSNVINFVIFYKQGVKDSVTVSYISLSFWNGCICFLTLVSILLSTIEMMSPMRKIDLIAVRNVYIAYARSVTHIMSTLITVYVSIEMCVYIIIPLKVKLMFTKPRSVKIHFAMVIFTVACNCPAWATQELRWIFDPRFNSTRLGLWLAKERPAVEIFFGVFTGNIIQITAQTVSIVCAVLLISGIKRLVNFRNQSTGNSIKRKGSITSKSPDSLPTISANVVTKQSSTRKKGNSKQYTKLAKMTVVIAILSLVFNIPVMVVSLCRTIVPGLHNTNLMSLLYIIVYASTLLNANTSICVYYRVSNKFRNTFRSLGCAKNRR